MKWRSSKPALVLAAVGLLAGACGNSPAEPTTTVPTTTTTTTTATTSTTTTATASTSTTTTTSTAPTTAVAGPGIADRFDVQGHRGARGLQPENTLPAFEVALDLGVTTLELDLHFTADDQVVVWHDPVVDPAKCRLDLDAPDGVPDPDEASDAALAIRNLTAAQLSGFTCDRNPDPGRFPEQAATPTDIAGADYRIITLTELFSFVERYARSDLKAEDQRTNAAQVLFNVETKRVSGEPRTIGDGFDGTNAGPFELALLDAIERAGVHSRVIVQSFDHRSLRSIRLVDAEIRLAALTLDPLQDPALFADWGATIWSPRSSTLDGELLARAQAAGLLVIPWTVNDPGEMQTLIELGVDGLITDRPDLLLGQS